VGRSWRGRRSLNLIQGLITGVLALALPLVPAAAEAPEPYVPDSSARFYMVGDNGFSHRWVDEETSIAEGLECNLYALCAFADIVGPACPDQVLVELDYFDEDDWYVTSVNDVLPGAGRQRHIRVELGTNLDQDLSSFEVADVRCYVGLPTGTPDL
jgi:hypothetical protein